jgi:L-cysteine/cystine lyase
MTAMESTDRLVRIRKQLGLPDEMISVNAGSWGPMCQPVRDTLLQTFDREFSVRSGIPSLPYQEYYRQGLEADRAEVGRLLHCSPNEITLCESTTMGLNIFLWGLDLEPGDEIVAGSLENPTAIVPLRILGQRKKVRLVYAAQGNGDKDSTQAIQEAINPRTKLVLISHVNFANGNRVDLKEISNLAHERGALVLADGIQAVGTGESDVKELGIDGYAMARHKFLCGPEGAGALYVSETTLQRIHPTFSGLFSDAGHGMAPELQILPSGQRFEISTRAVPIFMAGTACLRWFHDQVGWEFAFERIRENREILFDLITRLKSVGLISLRDQQSGLITFSIDGLDPVEIVERLKTWKIGARTINVTKPKGVRIAVGFWTRESDLEIMARAVASIAG